MKSLGKKHLRMRIFHKNKDSKLKKIKTKKKFIFARNGKQCKVDFGFLLLTKHFYYALNIYLFIANNRNTTKRRKIC